VDVEKFQQMAGDCPNEFLQTALCCCQVINNNASQCESVKEPANSSLVIGQWPKNTCPCLANISAAVGHG